MARLAVGRRGRHELPVLTYGPFALDVESRTLTRGDVVHALTPKECRLLATFIAHVGQVLTRQYLMKEVWDTDFAADTRTLEVHVHWIRSKLEDDVRTPSYLHTVRGVGYILRPF
jgi:DNA-binding response OmpR family regulator